MELQQLIAFAKETQGALKWDTSSLIRVGGQIAVKVNALQGMSGQEKQKLTCQILKTVLEDVEKKEKSEVTSEEEKASLAAQFAKLRQVVDDVVPASLDLAVAASRGKLDLKKVKMSVWVRYFSCCLKSVVTALVSQKVISQEQAKSVETVVVAVEAKATEVAEKVDATRFEQENPMHTATQEEPKTELKSEETAPPAESKPDTAQ